ncbi:hypothetical protein LWI28_008881 [Acer negundo]|uniref:Pentatricopeptide repeat-containing protein n=1 Tax=Acer negundo TaxID=4023 RepID=A0AAD5P431_ACENE|nr:hypothetical protein LWI28_008881 [Acer negundo]
MISSSKLLSKTQIQNAFFSRFYHTNRVNKSTLHSKISTLGNLKTSVIPELENWVKNGNKVQFADLQQIIHDLRQRKHFTQALEVSEWMNGKGICVFTPVEHAVQLDLIGSVHGSKLKSPYQKMKEMGLASSPLTYNNIMSLYTKLGQYEKVPDVLTEMKENNVFPDNFSYRICINSYGARSDIEGMEKILKEMESKSRIVVDWNTYAIAANFYIKSNLNDKALNALKKAEARLGNEDGTGYNFLISLYASLGNTSEVLRLWNLEKEACKRYINRDYITMLESLVKLGELEEAEKVLKDWESSGNIYNFHVPNRLIIGYCKNGLYEKAEAMLEGLMKKGRVTAPNSWAIVAMGYHHKDQKEKAFKCMMVSVNIKGKGWDPNPKVVTSILNWIGDEGSIQDVEAFVASLRKAMPVSREMYHALIKAYIRNGKEVDQLLNQMKVDKIVEDEETKKLLTMRQK